MNDNDAVKEGSPLDLSAIRERLAGTSGKTYWRSLDELADSPEFQDYLLKEFPRQAAPLEGSLNRRDFVKLLGASLALAGLTSCANPEPREKIVPYVRQPEEVIPGKPLYFATAITRGGYARGVLVESHTGRPTKIEGNPDHPASLGATDIYTQAAILGMWDPDRSRTVTQQGKEQDWQSFVSALQGALGQGNGQGVYLLSEPVTSPTLGAQIRAFQDRYPQASWHQYDPAHDDFVRAGMEMAFGEELRPLYDFRQTDVILSLGADFLAYGPYSVRYARDFSSRRRIRQAKDDMNRLYTVESTPSLTGGTSDHRIAVQSGQMEAFTRAIAKELGVDVQQGAGELGVSPE
ncbi:MAG TPA: TAT-variant-translocated molybdopterin oxidoreductase, partial [Trueperaceae bacterium]